jgi:hypothetical protein
VAWDDLYQWLAEAPRFEPGTIAADEGTTLVIEATRANVQISALISEPDNAFRKTFFWVEEDARTANIAISFDSALSSGSYSASELSSGFGDYIASPTNDRYIFTALVGAELTRTCKTDIAVATFTVQ